MHKTILYILFTWHGWTRHVGVDRGSHWPVSMDTMGQYCTVERPMNINWKCKQQAIVAVVTNAVC